MTLPKLTFIGALFLVAGPAAMAAPGQTNAPACSATVAENATAGKVDLTAGTDIFSGELLRTSDAGRLLLQCGSVKFALASNSSMRVFRDATRTVVELEDGILDYSTAGQSEDLALYGLDVKIVPDTKQPAIGQIDVASHCELSVQSTKGNATVFSGKTTKLVEESKNYDITPKLGVDYSDDWRPVPADYPEFPGDARYHESHRHVACAAATPQNASVKAPLNAGEFKEIAAAGAAGGIGVLLWHHFNESESNPSGH